MFGLGDYRATDVYLATVPASGFESGAGTRYFAGLVNGAADLDRPGGRTPCPW